MFTFLERLLGLLAFGDFILQFLNAGYPSHQPDGHRHGPTEEADDLLEKLLCRGIPDNHKAVQGIEMSGDVEDAGEQEQGEPRNDPVPSLVGGLEHLFSHPEKEKEETREQDGEDDLQDHVGDE